MIKMEVLDPELSDIGWIYFKFPWCTGYFDLFIQKETDDLRLHRL